jgi:hypothetical protein
MPLDLLRGAELAAEGGGGGDDTALEMLSFLSGPWVQGLLRFGGLTATLHDDVYSNVVNGGLCDVFSGSAYGTASEIVDGRNISVFINCNEVSFCLLGVFLLSLFVYQDA